MPPNYSVFVQRIHQSYTCVFTHYNMAFFTSKLVTNFYYTLECVCNQDSTVKLIETFGSESFCKLSKLLKGCIYKKFP